MKNTIWLCMLLSSFIACNQQQEVAPTSPPPENMQQAIEWHKSYPPEEILTLRKYIKVTGNRLLLDIDQSKAIKNLGISKEAYQDLTANLKSVNSVIDTAEKHDYYIDLSLEENAGTKTSSGKPVNVFYHKDSKKTPEISTKIPSDTLYKPDPELLKKAIKSSKPTCSMSANSRVEFHTKNESVISGTTVNTSVFLWTFMIYNEVWEDMWGENGIGIFGIGGDVIPHLWIYKLLPPAGGCNWNFRNVSSNTDGVIITHYFYDKAPPVES